MNKRWARAISQNPLTVIYKDRKEGRRLRDLIYAEGHARRFLTILENSAMYRQIVHDRETLGEPPAALRVS